MNFFPVNHDAESLLRHHEGAAQLISVVASVSIINGVHLIATVLVYVHPEKVFLSSNLKFITAKETELLKLRSFAFLQQLVFFCLEVMFKDTYYYYYL